MKTREIIGKWEFIGGKVIADSNCKTIESMIKNELIKLESSEGGWTSKYQGNDGRIWELSYPESHLQGGGPPKLIQISSGMRRIANLTKPKDGIKRLMIFNDDYGTYLFGYKKTEDCGAEWDEWYETENDAMELCETEYGIIKSDWTEIPNPEPNCQHDWINPVRIKGSDNGKPEFGKLEKLINGKWTEFEPTE